MTSLFGAGRAVVRSLHMSARTAGQTNPKGPAGVFPNVSGYKKVQELQNHMCKDDGRLIWQKMGMRDTVLYQVTMFLFFVGFIPMGYTLYKLSFPAKKD